MGQANKLPHQSVAHSGLPADTQTREETQQDMAFPFSLLVSRQQVFLAFSVVAFAVFSWAILQYLNRVTAWLFYLTVPEVISLLAYTLLFALLESMLITVGLVLLAAVLPGFLFRQNFVPLTTAMILPLALGAMAIHYFENNLRAASLPAVAGALVLYVLLSFGLYLSVQRIPVVADRFRHTADRVSVLAYLYLPLSLVSLLIVIIRNI